MHERVSVFLTLSDEQAVTLEAAIMKSRISMVAPGRPILKNLGLQCFMMVFTMSCRNHTFYFLFCFVLKQQSQLEHIYKQPIVHH